MFNYASANSSLIWVRNSVSSIENLIAIYCLWFRHRMDLGVLETEKDQRREIEREEKEKRRRKKNVRKRKKREMEERNEKREDNHLVVIRYSYY